MKRLMLFVYLQILRKIGSKAFTYNEYKEVTHHLQQVVELFLYKTDIHLVVVDNYKLRAGGV